jgi:D-arabinose 5-phosphate isomerase GutQ
MAADNYHPTQVECAVTPEFERPFKRKREAPLTPPIFADEPLEAAQTLDKAIKVLSVEATALSHATRLYQTDPIARDGLCRAVDAIVRAHENGSKLIICGVGKSGLVGMKTVATMKSLGIGCSFMHAAEALHGDLGDIRQVRDSCEPDLTALTSRRHHSILTFGAWSNAQGDVLMFITYSGRTAELLSVLAHVGRQTELIVLTSHTSEATCAIHEHRPDAILLPAPIHELEEISFGVNAPTTSTTVAMAVGDMLAIASADKIHDHRKKQVFLRNHPGGAIGVEAKRLS